MKAIAVHPDLTYAVLRRRGGILIVARDRVEALSSILGSLEDLGNLKGLNPYRGLSNDS